MAITWQGWMRYLGGQVFNADEGTQYSGPMGRASDAGVVVTDDKALAIGTVFRCIRIISEVGALLPITAYKILPKGDREPLPDSHWLQKLIKYPNEVMTGDQLTEALLAQEAGWGNAYAEVVRDNKGQPREVWPYKVDRMEVKRLPDRSISYRYPDAHGSLREQRKGSVMHMRGFTLDGVMGLSPLALARNAAGIALQAETYAATFYAAGGVPTGVMTSERLLNDPQRKQIRDEYGGMAGTGGGQRFWLLEAGLKYQPLTVNPEDMQMLLTRSFQVADLARFFGVPLFLLFETEKSTSWGSGIEQQNIALKTYTLAPYAQDLANAWNFYVVPPEERGKICVDVDLEALQTADFAALSAYYGNLGDKGYITRNEGRRKLKLPRMDTPNADKLTVQSQMVTIDKIDKDKPAPRGVTPPGQPPDPNQPDGTQSDGEDGDAPKEPAAAA